MNEIINRCMQLSVEQRKELICFLKDSIKEGAYYRFRKFLDIATEILGDGIISESRKFNCMMGRKLIAYQMRKEGCSLQYIGRCLNKNHATILYAVKSMEDAISLKHIFKVENMYLNEFEKRLKDYDIHSRTTQGS